MKNNLSENFFRKAKKINLDKEKKILMKESILKFMKNNPIKVANEDTGANGISRGLFAGIFNILTNFLSAKAVQVASIAAAILLVGGVVSADANYALPGDVLYPVKLGVNERILSVLAISDQAKVNLDIKLANRRLQEAEKLAVQGKLNDNNQEEISNNFADKTDELQKNITKLNDKAAVKITSDFESSLRAHGHILGELQKNEVRDAINSLSNQIQNATLDFSNLRSDLEDKVINNSGATIQDQEKTVYDKLDAAQNVISDVSKLIEKKKSQIGSQGVTQSEDNLNLAKRKIDEGKNKIKNTENDYKGAFSAFQESIIISQESKHLIDNKTNLGANINIGISDNEKDNSSENVNNNGNDNQSQDQNNEIRKNGGESTR